MIIINGNYLRSDSMELMNKKIVEANIQLQDENKELKKTIKEAVTYIEETPLQKGTEAYRMELLEILKEGQYE